MPQKCPYCDKEVAARGRKNHVRLMTDGGHGPKGEVPDSFENDVQGGVDGDEGSPEGEASDTDDEADSGESDADTAPSEVTADEIGETEPDTPDDGGDSDGYPFDPEAEGAIELDGDETVYVRVDGDVYEADVTEGDWLLITDDGPVLYDDETGDRFEVVTA